MTRMSGAEKCFVNGLKEMAKGGYEYDDKKTGYWFLFCRCRVNGILIYEYNIVRFDEEQKMIPLTDGDWRYLLTQASKIIQKSLLFQA